MRRMIYEKLADVQHDIWASWMNYLFSLCRIDDNGDYIIPSKSVKHWQRQIETDYKDLTEKEKDGDREQVDKYLHLINQDFVAPRP